MRNNIIRWQDPGNPKAMAQEVEDAYTLRLVLQSSHGVDSLEAGTAEERADLMYEEFERMHGAPYNRYL